MSGCTQENKKPLPEYKLLIKVWQHLMYQILLTFVRVCYTTLQWSVFYGGESKPLSACVTKSEWYIYAIPYFLSLVWKIMQILQSKMMLQKFCKAIKTNRLPPEKFAFLVKHLKNWNRCDLLTREMQKKSILPF